MFVLPRLIRTLAPAVVFVSLPAVCHPAVADTFGTGANQFVIEFVVIGDPGNAARTVGAPNPILVGSVPYVYRIGKFEVSRDMIEKANAEGGLGLPLAPMDFVVGGPRSDMPATGVSWNQAARFTNWLNTSEGFPAAYKFSEQAGDPDYNSNANIELWALGDPGFDAANPFRNGQAQYFLPSLDEWYKAAYYDPATNDGVGGYWEFPTGSDMVPTAVANGIDLGTAVYSGQNGPADIAQAGGLSYRTMARLRRPIDAAVLRAADNGC